MVDLNMGVFSFAFKDIIGEVPSLHDIRARLESDLEVAIGDLEGKSASDLQSLLEEYLKVKRELDVRAGSMALSHEKIEMFTRVVSRYVSAIRNSLEKTK